MHNNNPQTIQTVSNLLGNISHLLNGLTPVTNTNNHPDINISSPEGVMPETVQPAPVWQREARPGDNFSGIEEALEYVREQAQNPVKNRYSTEEHFAWSDLPELHRVIKPIMKLARVTASQEYVCNDAGVPCIKTVFCHVPTLTEKTYWLDTTSLKGVRKNQNLDECQQMGWTITYCRRYAYYAALDLQPDDMGDMDAVSRRARTTRATGPQTSPATSTAREWLPDVGAPGWEAAEARAVALGATPYTHEQIERAKENKRWFSELTREELALISTVTVPLAGDYRGIQPIQDRLKDELFESVRTGAITLFDEEDTRRALMHTWVQACTEYSTPDDVAIVPDMDCTVTTPPPAYEAEDLASLDAVAVEEIDRLSAKRDAHNTALTEGLKPNTSGNPNEDEIADKLFIQVKSGMSPQPPFDDEEAPRPKRDLTNEHAILMRQKVKLCQEIADGDGTINEKRVLIKKVLSHADFNAAAEIRQILDRLTNTGAPASAKITEEDIPY